MTKIQEKKHRLDKEFYVGEKIVSFTIYSKAREKIFTNENIFLIFRDMLLEAIGKGCCDAPIYLFMPDHLHLVLQGRNENSDVFKFVDLFKKKTGFWFGQIMNYSR